MPEMFSHVNVNSWVWQRQVDQDRMVGEGMMRQISVSFNVRTTRCCMDYVFLCHYVFVCHLI
jgi:hypothetical protein